MTATSNRLAVLAAEIKDTHQATIGLARTTTGKAVEVGRLLTEAKGLLPHGEWAAWLREHCRISHRTASRYMRLASDGNWPRVANLAIRAADEALARHGTETTSPPSDDE